MIALEEVDQYDLVEAYCKLKGKWGVCVHLGYDPNEDTPETYDNVIETDLPLWPEYWPSKGDVRLHALIYGYALFLADTEEECMSIYHKVRGCDGLPTTQLPDPYCAPGDSTGGRMYAYTVSPTEGVMTENT